MNMAHHAGLRDTRIVAYVFIRCMNLCVISQAPEPEIDAEHYIVFLVVLFQLEALEIIMHLLIVNWA